MLQAYKYVPFGPVAEVVPYLVRRAQENSDIMAGVAREKGMIAAEMWRRLKSATGVEKMLPTNKHVSGGHESQAAPSP